LVALVDAVSCFWRCDRSRRSRNIRMRGVGLSRGPEKRVRLSASPGFGLGERLEGEFLRRAVPFNDLAHAVYDAVEADLAVVERVDRFLIRSVEHRWVGSARPA